MYQLTCYIMIDVGNAAEWTGGEEREKCHSSAPRFTSSAPPSRVICTPYQPTKGAPLDGKVYGE